MNLIVSRINTDTIFDNIRKIFAHVLNIPVAGYYYR